MWEPFKKYHYLDHVLHTAAEQWVGLINGELACHTGVIQFPMRKGWKRIHRLVVLPDFQGIGIGTKFINAVSEYYIEKGFKVNLTTTTPSLVNALRRSSSWVLFRFGRMNSSLNDYFSKHPHSNTKWVIAESKNRITYSFNFNKTV